MSRRTPLAWRNLTHDRRRMVVAAGGIGFAVLLMFIELGFLNALLDSTVEVLRLVDGQVLIVSRARYALPAEQRFSIRRIYQARSCPGVQVSPLYFETYYAVLRSEGEKGYPIRVLAFDLEDPILQIPAVARYQQALREPGVALADAKSRQQFGFPADSLRLGEYRGELAGQSIRLIGSFELGTDFAHEGNLIMGAENFARFFSRRAGGEDPLSVVDLGVVRVQNEQDVPRVKQQLAELLAGGDVEVLTKDELIEREKKFWRTSAPVGYIFLVGAVMGFIVGVVICYQVIFTDISDHLPEFATLKAMGYTDGYFVRLVVVESLLLSLVGFVPGTLVAAAVYQGLAEYTGLLLLLTPMRVVVILMLTVGMCMLSGLLAMRKVMRADPAELF